MAQPEQSPLRVGIVGSGNIGTDLMLKIERTPALELAGVAGIDPESDGLARAADRGHFTTAEGLPAMLASVEGIDLVFDATSARAHEEHARLLAEHGARSVDLTPAALGPPVIPGVNVGAHLAAPAVNLVTFGAHDLVCSTRFAEPLRGGIANSELVIFDHLSHAGLHEDAEGFNRATLEFLTRQHL